SRLFTGLLVAIAVASPAPAHADPGCRRPEPHCGHASSTRTDPTSMPTADDAYADPARELGATSPSCHYALDATRRRNCRQSGSALAPHPLSAYGLDVRSGFSLTDPGKSLMGALQSIGAAVWMALLYVVDGDADGGGARGVFEAWRDGWAWLVTCQRRWHDGALWRDDGRRRSPARGAHHSIRPGVLRIGSPAVVCLAVRVG